MIPTVLTPVVVPVLSDPAGAIMSVAEALQPDLAEGFQIDTLRLRVEMERAFGGSDADGTWDWKLAYEAGEVALVLFLRKFGRALMARAGSPAGLLPILAKVARLLPTHTRRSEEMERFQQFSTPLPMALVAMAAAQITPRDLVLEPSAGTGLLAILAEITGSSLALNELADTRADLLRLLFPGRPVSTFDAAQIDDHLDFGLRPSVILMNPPYSAVANVDGRSTETTARHLRSALARLAPGGRPVAITGAGFAPDAPTWTETFDRLTESAHLVFTGAVSGAAFAKHGTSFETRVSVFDKCRGGERGGVTADLRHPMSPDAADLLSRINDEVPRRLELDHFATAIPGRSSLFPGISAPATRKAIGISRATPSAQPDQSDAQIEAEDLACTIPCRSEKDQKAIMDRMTEDVGGLTVTTAYVGRAIALALAEGLAQAQPPVPGLIEVARYCGLTDLRPDMRSTSDLSAGLASSAVLTALSPQQRVKLIKDSEDWWDRYEILESWFEESDAAHAILDKARSARSAEAALWKWLETRRDWWARIFIRAADVLEGAESPDAASFAACAMALIEGRDLKKIPVMLYIHEQTIEAWVRDDPSFDPGTSLEELAEEAPAPEKKGEFAALLRNSGLAIDRVEAYLTSVVIAPQMIAPNQWLAPILDAVLPRLDRSKLQRFMDLLMMRAHEVSDLTCDARAFAASMAKRSKKGQGDWAVGFSDASQRFRAAWPKKGMTKEDPRLLEMASDGLAVAELSEFATLIARRQAGNSA